MIKDANMLRKLGIPLLIISLFFTSCQEDLDDVIRPSGTIEINDFVWKALSVTYFFLSDSPDLGFERFGLPEERYASNPDYLDYLSSFQTPEILFESLKVSEDRFSIIVSDYRVLENSSQGVSLQNGMRFGLVRIGESNQIFGYVRYVVPNSPADVAGVERGMIFRQVDGVDLTDSNFGELLFERDEYFIGLAELVDNQLITTGQIFSLTKVELTENPIHIAKTLDVNGQKVGYLMYNAFRSNFESQLNQAFGDFLAEGATDLVIDLRYNGGGSVETAKDLSSMVTGQFNGDLFAKLTYNENFEDIISNFDNTTADGESINSLNLSKVYILTSGSSASASELVINALSPYIDVVQIGTNTVGKFQGSQLLYDSPNFNRQDVNTGHFYALQPLIFEIENAEGFTGFEDGLEPDISQAEDFFNLGILGEPTEPLLSLALQDIGSGIQGDSENETLKRTTVDDFKLIGESGSELPDFQRMYIDRNMLDSE
jgi:C-terminal processing protease CtpA/Prc